MNPDIQAHELADMRRAADKMPHEFQQKFHALLDAYEDSEAAALRIENAAQNHEKVEETIAALKKLVPDPEAARPDSPLSDDAWSEYLADCTPSEMIAVQVEELKRARGSEAALLKRIEVLEEGIESAIEDLGLMKEP